MSASPQDKSQEQAHPHRLSSPGSGPIWLTANGRMLDLSTAAPEEVEAALDALLTKRYEKERGRMQAMLRSGATGTVVNKGRGRLGPWDSARDCGRA